MFVKDLSLAETGNIQISLAEKDMPGLMALRRLKDTYSLKGARIAGWSIIYQTR